MADAMMMDQDEKQDPRLPSIGDLMGLARGAQGNPLTPARGAVAQPPAAMPPPMAPQPAPQPMAQQSQPEETGTTAKLDPARMPDALQGIVGAPSARPISADQQEMESRRQASEALQQQMMGADAKSAALSGQRATLAPLTPYGPDKKVLPQYRQGIGTRLAHLGTDFIGGLAHGGLLGGVAGAARGAIDPRDPGYYGKGAINGQYAKDAATREAQVGNLEQQIGDQDKLSTALRDSYGKVNSAEAADARAQAANDRASTYEGMLKERERNDDLQAKDREARTAEQQRAADLRDKDAQARITALENKPPTTVPEMTLKAQQAEAAGDTATATILRKALAQIQAWEVQKTREGKTAPDTTARDLAKAVQIESMRVREQDKLDKDKETERDKRYKADFKANMPTDTPLRQQARAAIDQQLDAEFQPKYDAMNQRIDAMSNQTTAGPKIQQGASSAAKPATASTPQEKTVKDAKGNTIKVVVRNGKWVNKATGAAL